MVSHCINNESKFINIFIIRLFLLIYSLACTLFFYGSVFIYHSCLRIVSGAPFATAMIFKDTGNRA